MRYSRLQIQTLLVASVCWLPLSRPASAQVQVVCIDPGHPSEVGRGTSGRHISEIQAAWQVAGRVSVLLKKRGVRVVLTKQSANEFVKNRRRAEIANGDTPLGPRSELLVRLHCDALAGSGFAVYYPDRQGTSGGRRGPSAEVILASRRAASRFHAALALGLKGELRDRGLHSDIDTAVGRKQGALTGSIYSQVPVLLVEMCVLTNPHDDAFMASSRGQDLMAGAIERGIEAAIQP